MSGEGAKRLHRIRVKDSEIEFGCGEDEFVLNAMIRAGGPIRHGCCGGGCGVCRMKVERGAVFAAKRMSSAHVSEGDRKEGIVLLCCVQPREDLLISRV